MSNFDILDALRVRAEIPERFGRFGVLNRYKSFRDWVRARGINAVITCRRSELYLAKKTSAGSLWREQFSSLHVGEG